MDRAKSLPLVFSMFIVALVALASTPQTVFAAGAIEGFAVGEALPE